MNRQDVNFLDGGQDEGNKADKQRFLLQVGLSVLVLILVLYLLIWWARSRVFSPFVDYDPLANNPRTTIEAPKKNHTDKRQQDFIKTYGHYREQLDVKPGRLHSGLSVLLKAFAQATALDLEAVSLRVANKKVGVDLVLDPAEGIYSSLDALDIDWLQNPKAISIQPDGQIGLESSLDVDTPLPQSPQTNTVNEWQAWLKTAVVSQKQGQEFIDALFRLEGCGLHRADVAHQQPGRREKNRFTGVLVDLSLHCDAKHLLALIHRVETAGIAIFWQDLRLRFDGEKSDGPHRLQFLFFQYKQKPQ